jgi:hypothetical protein
VQLSHEADLDALLAPDILPTFSPSASRPWAPKLDEGGPTPPARWR